MLVPSLFSVRKRELDALTRAGEMNVSGSTRAFEDDDRTDAGLGLAATAGVDMSNTIDKSGSLGNRAFLAELEALET